MLEFLDAKEELVPVLQNSDDMNISIRIGKDNELRDGMPECAIVTASYKINGMAVGNASVIGPIRMDYSKVVICRKQCKCYLRAKARQPIPTKARTNNNK